MDSLILASRSPRRREILQMLDIPFIVSYPQTHVEKPVKGGGDVKQLIIENSREKALNVSDNFKNGIILGIDTVVVIGDKTLEKPSGEKEEMLYLKLLSGKMHLVYSGITLIDVKEKRLISDIAKTKVYFKKLSLDEINWYIESNEWIDKAGGYAIQGRASFYVKEIKGSFFNVVGLPVELMYDMLKKFNYFYSSGRYRPVRKM